MICDEARAFLQDYADEKLSEAARATVERHVGDCAACRTDLKAMGFLEERLRGQPMLPEPPGLVDRVMARLFPAKPHSFRRELFRFAAAALVLIGITVGLLSVDLGKLVGDRTTRAVERSIRVPIESTVNRIDGWYHDLLEEE